MEGDALMPWWNKIPPYKEFFIEEGCISSWFEFLKAEKLDAKQFKERCKAEMEAQGK